MKNATFEIISTVVEGLSTLILHVEDLRQDCDDEATIKRVAKAQNKLSSALGMVQEAFKLLDQDN